MRKKKRYLLAVIVLCGALASCAHYSKFVEAQAYGAKTVPSLFLVGEVALEQRVPDPALAAKIPEILSLIGRKHGVTVVADKANLPADRAYGLLHLRIKEQP